VTGSPAATASGISSGAEINSTISCLSFFGRHPTLSS
jgi:hypothetical protein